MKQCPPGEIYRKSYTRNRKRIAGKCIRSQTRSPRLTINRSHMRGYRIANRSLKNCPRGYIKRAAFVRTTRKGKRSHVPEQCIQNVGAPGKGLEGPIGRAQARPIGEALLASGARQEGSRGIGPLRKGELTKFGYENVAKLSVAERHAALRKAIDAYGSLGVWRKLNAVQIYTRRISPGVSAIFKADMDWIRSTFGIKAF
jgi:hypothetical protein